MPQEINSRFLLIDRDGTLIVEKEYLSQPDDVELIPGAAHALADARQRGWKILLLSNQSGIGRGYFTETDLAAVHERLNARLSEAGARLDGIYYCPHSPDDRCLCRKPGTGLVEQAVGKWHFDPAFALVVGDKDSDLALGRAVGAKTCLVRTGYGRRFEQSHAALADFVIDDLGHLPEVLNRLDPGNEFENCAAGV